VSIDYVLQPRFMSISVDLAPVVVFLSLFVWAILLGGMGALLAVPLTLALRTMLEAFPGSRWVGTLLRHHPPLVPGAAGEGTAAAGGRGGAAPA
jgi:predicted PurR-regulated permease PerM